MLHLFNKPWREVSVLFIDVESTGLRVGVDKACQLGFARFDGGKFTAGATHLVNPNMPIPESATAIHGITDAMVQAMKTAAEVFELERAGDLFKDAQPAAFNASFDKHFVPPEAVERDWPWLDCLSLIRVKDRFVAGKGRHKLTECCKRHGIELTKAHDAGADARAAGELFYKVAPTVEIPNRGSIKDWTLGMLLCWQGIEESREWYRHMSWRSKQPPMEDTQNG
jgi:DNA polymerase III subunit epsilon